MVQIFLFRSRSKIYHMKMKIIILLGFLGATLSAPLLLNLNNGQLLPLQLQGPLNSWIPPFSGILQQQQQAQIPGLSQFSLSALDQFAGLLPNQIPLTGEASFAQGAQAGQVDPLQLQTPPQTQPGPSHVMPYVFSFKMPQEQGQMFQYYPVYMVLPWEQPQQTVPRSPQQTRQQQYEEQIPFYAQFGYIPQLAEPAISGGQQQLAFDPQLGTAPEIAVMSTGEETPYLQKEAINFRHDSAGVFMPSTSPKPSTTNVFTSAVDQTITPELPEEKDKTDSLREP
ncbi:odontogenic ameloblast-associated protein isoform X2 [Homo sapiens]|uniref:odontogenic ameloblast-associated protein isoform X2 n=1 Tax=Homo sapiens TaxID=9606 RepID=UPI0023DFBE40|nr:odontogenic ameloblast-associated protein isoform X2 [Homo sapiens]